MDDAGKMLGNHWPLLALLGAGAIGMATALRLILNALDARHHENQRLFFTDGGRELLHEIVKSGTLEALSEHTAECPVRERVASLDERIVTLERKQ